MPRVRQEGPSGGVGEMEGTGGYRRAADWPPVDRTFGIGAAPGWGIELDAAPNLGLDCRSCLRSQARLNFRRRRSKKRQPPTM